MQRLLALDWGLKAQNGLFVKLKSQVQTSVLGLRVDFDLPLSQEEEEEEEEEDQEPPPKSMRL